MNMRIFAVEYVLLRMLNRRGKLHNYVHICPLIGKSCLIGMIECKYIYYEMKSKDGISSLWKMPRHRVKMTKHRSRQNV